MGPSSAPETLQVGDQSLVATGSGQQAEIKLGARADSRWLKRTHPEDERYHVSHETIYRSLFVQARGDRLIKDATARKINMIAAWSVDRLGRSLQDLVGFLNELQAVGCNLYLHQQALDTTTPSGRAMFQMCGVFAEFERCMIRDRVNSGLARAKANGVEMGRGKRKDGERNADEVRWGMSTAEMEQRMLSLRN